MTNNKNIVEELTPATGKVDIETLLNNIEGFISQRAILPPGASAAITLWCLAAYNINQFRIFPKLTIYSPEMRCGKSITLDLIETFAPKAIITSNTSTASIFRLIDECQPTLIIDEADTFVAGESNSMTGIINSGHAKNRAFVNRCVGETFKVKRFSTWSPMVLASIGDLQPTIMDRSIAIKIRRKSKHETVKRIQPNLFEKAKPSRRQLLKWSLDNANAISMNPVEPPDLGNSRAVDNWLPLFTIASMANNDWLEKCEKAYRLFNKNNIDPEATTLLLQDIQDIFQTIGVNKISSEDLVNRLTGMLDHPWCEYKNGGPITQNGLARMLKPYEIKPKGIRLNDTVIRGYNLNQFADTFNRYL